MKYNIFIDGGEGTTGMKIRARFTGRDDVNLLTLPEEKRKDPASRKEMLNKADFVFLCLPDQAAREAVAMVENPEVKIIDASTAHRVLDDWTYGLPELSESHRANIKNAKRVAVPGCYASGFISLVYPLVAHEIISKDHPITCFGLSGYSGGGKQIVANYQKEDKEKSLLSPRIYALPLAHKHLPEMQKISGLNHPPVFTPVIDNYYAGMLVSVQLSTRTLQKKLSAQDIHKAFSDHYANQTMIRTMPFQGETVLPDGFLPANALENQDIMEIFVCGNEEQILLTARLDNLGKGASGAAVQCMNIMMGIDQTTGLNVPK